MDVTFDMMRRYLPVKQVIDEYTEASSVVNLTWSDFCEWLEQRIVPEDKIKPFTELSEDEVLDECDSRYPSEEFLISLAYSQVDFTEDNFSKAMSLMESAWYRFEEEDFYYNNKTGEYVLYTFGWSGNEDILDAFVMSGFGLVCKVRRDAECTALFRIKNPFFKGSGGTDD